MILVSACLCGINCNYLGKSWPNPKVLALVKEGKAIPVCPEQLGGLPTPRPPAEQRLNKVFTKEGKDVTDNFIRGAKEALKIAKLYGCKEAILKAKSPACGCGEIYDGTFTETLIAGDGIFTKMLKQNKIKVLTENDL